MSNWIQSVRLFRFWGFCNLKSYGREVVDLTRDESPLS